MSKVSKVLKVSLVSMGILYANSVVANELICKQITNQDLSIPANVVGYTTDSIDVSKKFNLGAGSIYVKAIKANTSANGKFRVNPTHHITFEMSGSTPVFIKASHGGILEARAKDKIFIGQNSSSYKLISSLADGLRGGENRNPGYYVKNTKRYKIRSKDFVWLSTEPETHISFGTNAGGRFNSRVGLDLCIISKNNQQNN